MLPAGLEDKAVLLASVHPRGSPYGEPGLAAIDADSLRVLSYREFQPEETSPGQDGDQDPNRQARGMVTTPGRLLVALSTSVNEYRVIDARGLELQLERQLTSPVAADLHGISLAGHNLVAASTGRNCVLVWDLRSRECRSVSMPAAEHLNDVWQATSGALVVCSLTRVLELSPGEPTRVLASDADALFHDARILEDGRMIVTDAARGELVLGRLDVFPETRIRVADAGHWFVRGLGIVGDLAYVLRSQVVENRRRGAAEAGPARERGVEVGLTVVDLNAGRVVAEADLFLPDVVAGSVAYKLVALSSANC